MSTMIPSIPLYNSEGHASWMMYRYDHIHTSVAFADLLRNEFDIQKGLLEPLASDIGQCAWTQFVFVPGAVGADFSHENIRQRATGLGYTVPNLTQLVNFLWLMKANRHRDDFFCKTSVLAVEGLRPIHIKHVSVMSDRRSMFRVRQITPRSTFSKRKFNFVFVKVSA